MDVRCRAWLWDRREEIKNGGSKSMGKRDVRRKMDKWEQSKSTTEMKIRIKNETAKLKSCVREREKQGWPRGRRWGRVVNWEFSRYYYSSTVSVFQQKVSKHCEHRKNGKVREEQEVQDQAMSPREREQLGHERVARPRDSNKVRTEI